jgi:nicotinamidase-related amidase
MNLLKPRGVYRDCCLAMPAIHALAEGYDVFIVSDASGGVTAEAHDMAVRRMVSPCISFARMTMTSARSPFPLF